MTREIVRSKSHPGLIFIQQLGGRRSSSCGFGARDNDYDSTSVNNFSSSLHGIRKYLQLWSHDTKPLIYVIQRKNKNISFIKYLLVDLTCFSNRKQVTLWRVPRLRSRHSYAKKPRQCSLHMDEVNDKAPGTHTHQNPLIKCSFSAIYNVRLFSVMKYICVALSSQAHILYSFKIMQITHPCPMIL